MKLFFVIYLSLVIYQPGSACTCVVPNIDDALNGADAVFLGTVRQVAPVHEAVRKNNVIVSFDVSAVFKGDIHQGTSLLITYGDLGCGGIRFEKGVDYLVFAKSRSAAKFFVKDRQHGDSKLSSPLFVTSECLRTQDAISSQARDDIQKLEGSRKSE